MKRWRLLLLIVLALSFADVAARAQIQIPGFAQQGLVMTYKGQARSSDNDNRGSPEPSSQMITVTKADQTLVWGTTMNTYDCDPNLYGGLLCNPPKPYTTRTDWKCSLNSAGTQAQECSTNPSSVGGIAQFWVDPRPNNVANSIVGPNNEPYVSENCPAEVTNAVSNVSCLHYIKSDTGRLFKEFWLAYDTTGLVKYSHLYSADLGTANGPHGDFVYTFQSMLPPQSDIISIFWQDITGTAKISDLDGTTVTEGPSIPKPVASKVIVGIGDFNGDGKSDILWQNRNSGALSIWKLDETGIIGQGKITDNNGTIINPVPIQGWHVVGTGDFNRDGKSDILLQKGTDEIDIWLMNGTERIGELQSSNPNPGPGWQAIGTGDFNLDGKSDILWWNQTGEVAISEMDGTRVITHSIALKPDPNWQAKGAGNFDGTGKSEILFQNITNKQVAIWNGTTLVPIPITDPLTRPGTDLNKARSDVVGISDYHSDDTTNPGVDILFQNKSTGAVKVWGVKGTSRIRNGPIASGGFFVMGVGE
jgi:FG-GAP-like repeat